MIPTIAISDGITVVTDGVTVILYRRMAAVPYRILVATGEGVVCREGEVGMDKSGLVRVEGTTVGVVDNLKPALLWLESLPLLDPAAAH